VDTCTPGFFVSCATAESDLHTLAGYGFSAQLASICAISFAGLCLLSALARVFAPSILDALHQTRLLGGTPLEMGLGEMLLLAWYLGMMAVIISVDLARRPEPTRAVRAVGICAAVSLSLVVLPTSRTALWQYVFGVSFERSIKVHRIAARFFWLICAIHMVW
jgi:hypothetical protein